MVEMQSNLEPKAVTNPLASYFRQPKIFIRLPSDGNFYPNNSIDLSANKEYAVYAMTAKDELLFKTPDALLNGQATVEVIKSCIPAIKDPWKMPSIDVDACLVAIRVATYGQSMDVNATCPSCSHINDYEFDLVNYLGQMNEFKFIPALPVGPLVIYIRPYSYLETTKAAIKAIEQQKIFDVVNDPEMSDEDKIDKFGKSFLKLTEMTVDVVCGCISGIQTPDGVVEDRKMIEEFINNANSDVFNTVNDHVQAMRNEIESKTQTVSCAECQHPYTINLTMDQSNFFVVRS
jgi:hypothetical protein